MHAAPVDSPSQVLPVPSSRPTILLVEDDKLLRDMTAANLHDIGMAVLEAADAAEAINVLQNAAHVDVVFTDIRMPGRMDGFDLARWIKLKHPTIEVLMASGSFEREDLPSDLCHQAFLPKPYDYEDLVKNITDLVASRVTTLTVMAAGWP